MADGLESKTSKRPRNINGAEGIYCVVVVTIFGFMATIISMTERPRDPTLQTIVQILFWCLLALMPIGVTMELLYRRSKVHGAVIFCIMITVAMWILFAAMLFPDR